MFNLCVTSFLASRLIILKNQDIKAQDILIKIKEILGQNTVNINRTEGFTPKTKIIIEDAYEEKLSKVFKIKTTDKNETVKEVLYNESNIRISRTVLGENTKEQI